MTETDARLTLKALGLKSLKEIPEHIPTVRWSWVVSGNKGKLAYPFLHAAFSTRIDAGLSELASREKGKGKQKEAPQVSPADADFSRIS